MGCGLDVEPRIPRRAEALLEMTKGNGLDAGPDGQFYPSACFKKADSKTSEG